MNAKISVFVICVEFIIYLLLYNVHDYAFKASRLVLQFPMLFIFSRIFEKAKYTKVSFKILYFR